MVAISDRDAQTLLTVIEGLRTAPATPGERMRHYNACCRSRRIAMRLRSRLQERTSENKDNLQTIKPCYQ